jgi:AraC family transcriptional regulator
MKLSIPDTVPRHSFHREGTAQFYERAIKRVISAMRDNLSEPLNLENLAKIAIISPYHFHRVFAEITGITPHRFLAALRIEKAKQLLATSTLGIMDVCFEVGYHSLGTFTATFTGSVGISPNRFRRLATQKSQALLVRRVMEQANSWNGFKNSIIEGTVSASASFTGTAFIGLYPTRVPQGFPVGGTRIIAPGHYRIERVPDGIYHLLAAAFDGSRGNRRLVLPEEGFLQVAHAGPISVPVDRLSVRTDLVLRPVDFSDPPVLIALPLLWAAPTPAEFESATTLQRRQTSGRTSWSHHITTLT